MRTAKIISAMALLLFGSAVVTFSLVVDPSGAIDYSVNTFFAEASATALIIFGLTDNYQFLTYGRSLGRASTW